MWFIDITGLIYFIGDKRQTGNEGIENDMQQRSLVEIKAVALWLCGMHNS